MRHDSELLPWLWRVPLALLLWVSANLALLLLAAPKRRLTGWTSTNISADGLTIDLMALRDVWQYVFLWSLAASAVVGVCVILLVLALRIAGYASLAQPAVRRALWLAGADVALPLALAAAALVYLWFNPPRLMF